MSREITHLKQRLAAWDTRLRLQHSLAWLPRGVGLGLLVGLGLALIARWTPLVPTPALALLGGLLALAGVIVVLLIVWIWPRSPLAVARRCDRLFGLKERTSTALELESGEIPTESEVLRRRQMSDALRAAKRTRPADHLPLRVNLQEWLVVWALALALAFAVLLPNPQDQVLTQQAEVQEAIEEQAAQLEELREQVEQDEGLSPDEQSEILEALDEAIQTLEQRGISQEEALAALGATERRLRDVSEQAARERVEVLQEASGLLPEGNLLAQEVMDALAEGDLAQLQEAVPDLTPEEAQALAEMLAEAAEALAEVDPELAQALAEAAQALQAEDQAAAARAMAEAAQRLTEAGQTADQIADSLQQSQSEVAQAGCGECQREGAGSGQGQGASQQQGQGGSSSGAGRGEGSGESVGGPQSGSQGGQMPTDNAPGDGGERPYDQVFVPSHLGGEGGPEVGLPSDPSGIPVVEGEFGANPTGQSDVPYNEVFADYAGAASRALDTGYVPLGMRDVIRDYFSSLDPER